MRITSITGTFAATIVTDTTPSTNVICPFELCILVRYARLYGPIAFISLPDSTVHGCFC